MADEGKKETVDKQTAGNAADGKAGTAGTGGSAEKKDDTAGGQQASRGSAGGAQ